VGRIAGFRQPLLYLDFDGVLHHENVVRVPGRGIYIAAPARYSLFQHAGVLEVLLDPYPDVRIVLSTTWVRVLGFSTALKRLPASLQARVIGATWHSSMHGGAFVHLPRGQQILDDVQRRQPMDWLAFDDDAVGWPAEHRERLVHTDPHEGISAPEVLEECRVKLRKLVGVLPVTGRNCKVGDRP
jgi:hypothetical protein